MKEHRTSEETLSVLSRNLKMAENRAALAQEQTLFCSQMLADFFCDEHGHSSAEALYAEFLSSLPNPNGRTKALFCRAFVSRNPARNSLQPQVLFGLNETPTAGSHGKIAYVRNRYNERAFENFSELLRSPKPFYVSDFSEACEAVFNGQCSYCILPIENTENGRLFGFYSMLDRYELKICATVSIDGEDSFEAVRFALVGRTALRVPAKASAYALEFCLTRENGSRLSYLLEGAECFHATPQKIDFLPLEYDQRVYRIFFTFALPFSEAAAFGLYLSLEYPNYNILGFYPIA